MGDRTLRRRPIGGKGTRDLRDEWRLERAAPGFHQRFIGVFRDDGRTIEGRWESSDDGAAWELHFPITYRKGEG